MLWIDRFEKIGRLVLWLTLASTVVIAPIEYIKQKRAEEQMQEAARKEFVAAERAAKDKAAKSERISLRSMGLIMRALSVPNASGHVWFTNVSSRTGVVCINGTATNPTTKASTDSLGACVPVGPYASQVEMKVMFAGGELAALCPQTVSCALNLNDLPDVSL